MGRKEGKDYSSASFWVPESSGKEAESVRAVRPCSPPGGKAHTCLCHGKLNSHDMKNGWFWLQEIIGYN